MKTLTPPAEKLLRLLEEPEKEKVSPGEPTLKVTRTVSAAAILYEKARNAVEFKEEHLIRRAAIERILKRRLITNSSNVGESLVRELLWARYLETEEVPLRTVKAVQETIDKYLLLQDQVAKENVAKVNLSQFILELASCEIEKKLVPAPHREAQIAFVYQTLKDQIILEEEKETKTHDIQVYIASHRGFAKSDEAIIAYELFSSFLPDFIEAKPQEIGKFTPRFWEVYQEIKKQLHYPLKDKLLRYVKKEAAPFLVIRDLAEEKPELLSQIFKEEEMMEKETKKILTRRYEETGARLRRAAIRSIIYIFLTKMVFALLLEFPFDLFVSKKANWLPLSINSLFPPFLMFLVTASINLPGRENTDRVIAKIKEYLYEGAKGTIHLKVQETTRRPILTFAFTTFYFAAFILIFGLILFLLNKLHFNIVSQGVFLFFLSVVSFFGWRIRFSTKDYTLEEKEHPLSPIVDFLFLPILRLGQWLSRELAQINVFLFLFDFIIEAPFKAFFEIVEEWVLFLRAKREEITT